MKATLTIPLEALAAIRAAPRLMERVYVLEALYREGHELEPIPLRMDVHGDLSLSRDGNHRLEAARRAGVLSVRVKLDARSAARASERYGARVLTPAIAEELPDT